MLRRALLFLCAAAGCGCSPAYVLKSWAGHRTLVANRRPIAAVLADPAAPAEVKEKLRLVEEVRRFAVETMGFPASKNYAEYAEVGRKAASWVVTASARTRLKPHDWWFPVAGRVPYKGYFDEAAARREAARLEGRGLDAHVGAAAAYSTLGWLRDPVLSTMLAGGPGRTAGILLHEAAHGALYFPGQGDFNESAASFLGEEGARAFLAARFGAASAESSALAAELAREAELARAVEEAHAELGRFYDGPGSEAEKLAGRAPLLARAGERLGLPGLNNAGLLALRRYRAGFGELAAAHAACGREFPRTLALLRALDRRRPLESLRERLASGKSCPAS